MTKEELLRQISRVTCRFAPDAGVSLGWEAWLLVAAASTVLLFVFTASIRKSALASSRNVALWGMLLAALVGLLLIAVMIHALDVGYVSARRGGRVWECINPRAYWTKMALYQLCALACIATSIACHRRLSRPVSWHEERV